MTGRAVTSASNLHRRALCPGSERLETGLPDENTEQSREGSLLHEYDANPALDRAVLRPNQQDLLRISGELDAFVFQRLGEQFGIDADQEPHETGREKELWVHRGIKAELSGHCDLWRYYPALKLLCIVDKKYGYREVTPAAANKQLRVYAVAGAELRDVENVVVAITQPRLPYEQRVTIANYTKPDIEAARAEIFSILESSKREDAPLVAGEEQCRYCRARMGCPAFQAKVQEGLMLVPVDNTGTVAKREADLAIKIAKLPDDQLDKVLVALQMADFVKELARDEARARIAVGKLAQWKVGKATEQRKIIDSARAIALLSLRGDLTKDEILKCCAPSLTNLEERIREKTKCTWDKAKELVNTALSAVIEKEPKKPSLTRVKEAVLLK
jgi:hypothetical protein